MVNFELYNHIFDIMKTVSSTVSLQPYLSWTQLVELKVNNLLIDNICCLKLTTIYELALYNILILLRKV